MKRPSSRLFTLLLAAAIALAVLSAGAVPNPPAAAKRPMQLADILAWKTVNPSSPTTASGSRTGCRRSTVTAK
jgi:hypothetical protein